MLASLDAGRLAGAWALTIGQAGHSSGPASPRRPAVRAADYRMTVSLLLLQRQQPYGHVAPPGLDPDRPSHNSPGQQHPPQQPPAKTGRDPGLDDRDRYPAEIRGKRS
ncbi:MAG TPA: hypothetical protein VFX25_28380 [Streptosporangiaceae bacterium]|nr:hypothetical protein [Streptosporangiaceae bacterium]